MAVNNINGSMSRADIKIQTAKAEITVKKEEGGTTATARTDSFVKSVSYQSVTYTAPKKLTDKQIEEINNSRTEQMRSMVAKMLGNQAKISDKAQGGFDIYEILGADATP